jgi:hypothetical protein
MEDPNSDTYVPTTRWPEGKGEVEHLAEICERVLEERCRLLLEMDAASGVEVALRTHYGIAYPVLIDDALHGVAAVEVAVDSETLLKSAMAQLQGGLVGWNSGSVAVGLRTQPPA